MSKIGDQFITPIITNKIIPSVDKIQGWKVWTLLVLNQITQLKTLSTSLIYKCPFPPWSKILLLSNHIYVLKIKITVSNWKLFRICNFSVFVIKSVQALNQSVIKRNTNVNNKVKQEPVVEEKPTVKRNMSKPEPNGFQPT